MKLSRNDENNKPKSIIRVCINSINGDILDCTHIISNFRVKAFYKEEMKLEPGQIVVVEYVAKADKGKSGYVVIDDLSEEIEARVLDAQHIIYDGIMYTSLVCEHMVTRARIHSLIPNYNRLFLKTNIIVKDDIVVIKINNGEIFNINRKES